MITLTFGGLDARHAQLQRDGDRQGGARGQRALPRGRLRRRRHKGQRISAGPVRTLAGAGITDARFMFNFHKAHAPLRRPITIEDVGGSALYLLSDLSRGVTGEIHFVDGGYNIVSMPRPENVKSAEAMGEEVEAAE